FNRAVETFRNAVSDMAGAVGDFIGIGGGDPPQPPTPPWRNWPHQPGNLPMSGDKAWLDVGRFMQGQGVLR
ncbi:MAG TPA: hypothetical protein VFT95_08480, partial [Micromonosporaceae bacterium]|nr:hypothetical protein [Micromonosporaceae bacterium]